MTSLILLLTIAAWTLISIGVALLVGPVLACRRRDTGGWDSTSPRRTASTSSRLI